MAFARSRDSKTWYAAWDCCSNADPDIPILKQTKAEYVKLPWRPLETIEDRTSTFGGRQLLKPGG
jgi:hypothetical protein